MQARVRQGASWPSALEQEGGWGIHVGGVNNTIKEGTTAGYGLTESPKVSEQEPWFPVRSAEVKGHGSLGAGVGGGAPSSVKLVW